MSFPAKAANPDRTADPQVREGSHPREISRTDDRRLTPAEVADRYGVSEYQVKERCRRKQWPHLRIGNAVRFTEEQVAEIDRLHTVPVAEQVTAARSWGRKTRGGAA